MKQFIRNNFLPLFLYLVCFFTSLAFLLNYEKVAIHSYLNQFVGIHFLNLFFYYITYLGDGNMAVLILLGTLLYNIRLGIYCTASFLSASLFSILLKHQFYDHVNRPSFVFKFYLHKALNVVDGTDLYIHNSFPSGHATQSFAIFMCLAFMVQNKLYKMLFFMVALLTAFSRVYLSQHWLVDITAGSFIGLSASILFYFIFIHKNTWPKLNRPLFPLRSH